MFKKTLFFIAIVTVFSIGNINAQHHEAATNHSTNEHGEKLSIRDEIKAEIKHHLQDNHEFHLVGDLSIPLPVILWDNGLHLFMSSKFEESEHGIVEDGGNFYKIAHENGHIYRTDASGKINLNEHGFPTNVHPLDFSITKTVVMMILTGLLMLLLFGGLAKSYGKNGGIAKGAGRFFEPIVLFIRDEIAIPNIGEKHYKRYMSYLLTIFFFIWFVNLFGLTPLGVNVTGNIAVTSALAILTYLITTFTANKNYWKHIFWMPGVPLPMKIILAPIELLGTLIKPFALTMRLYANMFAGHIVLMSIIGLIFIYKSWVGGPLSFGLAFGLSILELLVAALQAYIFTVLSALYFGSAVEEHSDH